MISVHEARQALGSRLRELRQAAGLSGRKLADSLSWPASKVSKLENGRQTPTDEDILAWTDATGSTAQADGLLASLHALELQHVEWHRVLRIGLRSRLREAAELDERTRVFRVFESGVIPSLLQTAEYARACFAQGTTVLNNLPNDADGALRLRMQRQDLLYRRDKEFHFVVTEAALRYRRCSDDETLAQLDRLVSLSALRNVRLGVIDFRARYAIGPWHGFWLLDDERVMVETYSAELHLDQPQEIALYRKVFDQLAGAATYGSAARGLIMKVMDDVSGTAADVPTPAAHAVP